MGRRIERPPISGRHGCPGPGGVGSARAADALVEAARQEGALSWYTSDTSSVALAIGNAFREACGITVEVKRKTTLPLVEQFSTATTRGGSPADLITVWGMGPAAGYELADRDPPAVGEHRALYLDAARLCLLGGDAAATTLSDAKT